MKELKVFKEFWRTVVINGVEHPRYMVSNFGKVKCKWIHGGKWKFCEQHKSKSGYWIVSIERKPKRVSRIVAETFIPNHEHKTEVDHISTVKTDNIVLLDDDGKTILYTNLRWTTPKENQNNPLSIKNHKRNATKHLLGKIGAEHNRSIPIVQLTLDGQFIKEWSCAAEAGRELKIAKGDISACCKGKHKSAGGFKWMYLSDWLKVCKRKTEDIKPLF